MRLACFLYIILLYFPLQFIEVLESTTKPETTAETLLKVTIAAATEFALFVASLFLL